MQAQHKDEANASKKLQKRNCHNASMNFVPPSKVRKGGFWKIDSAGSKPSCESRERACSIETGEEGTRGVTDILTGVAETVEMLQLGGRTEWDAELGDGGRSCEYMLGTEYRMDGALASS